MADCKIVNAGVVAALNEIEGISNSYKSAGNEFMASLKSAISLMEGESKDALETFFNKSVEEFTVEQLPGAITGMRTLLEENRKNFEEVDRQLAESISGGK